LMATLFSVVLGANEETVSVIKTEYADTEKAISETDDTPPTSRDASNANVTTQTLNDTEALADSLNEQIDAPRPGSTRFAENMRLDLPELSFQARFPAGSSEDPAYLDLMEGISIYRERVKVEAAAQKADREKSGLDFTQWSVDILFREIQRSGKIVSAIGREYSYTGGVHPNLNWQGLVANFETGELLAISDLFKPRAQNSPALAIAACEALKTAKIERIGEATIDGDAIDCGNPDTLNKLYKAELTLTSSTTTGRFGGIALFYSPYALGPYAEGPYTLMVTQEVFREDLRPEIQILFDGEAVQPRTN